MAGTGLELYKLFLTLKRPDGIVSRELETLDSFQRSTNIPSLR